MQAGDLAFIRQYWRICNYHTNLYDYDTIKQMEEDFKFNGHRPQIGWVYIFNPFENIPNNYIGVNINFQTHLYGAETAMPNFPLTEENIIDRYIAHSNRIFSEISYRFRNQGLNPKDYFYAFVI